MTDIACPGCRETERLRGHRTAAGEIELTCEVCGATWPRDMRARCATCGSTELVTRPLALRQKARGNAVSFVGVASIGLCRTCDADALDRHVTEGGAIPSDYTPAAQVRRGP
jgi:hypothetical protein